MLLFSREIKLWMPFVSVWLIVTVMWRLRLLRLVRREIVLPMRFFVRHLVSVILVMVLELMLIVTSVHPNIISGQPTMPWFLCITLIISIRLIRLLKPILHEIILRALATLLVAIVWMAFMFRKHRPWKIVQLSLISWGLLGRQRS